ncbi:putative penicillin-binding protein [Gordonia araii NBRC 100433]|uniref:Putative penicillin-binding protein n=1 Tax=Gordonia araii NBRC 100433 TaxID=1073574 RepID=G7H6F4_9ACTN|nr:putative penicillin-binding protein [Gordonia araii NBRC 100433]
MIHDYANAVSQQNIQRAASLTTAPGQASDALTATMDGMHAMRVETEVVRTVDYSDGTAGFELKTTYRWEGGRQFVTATQGTARNLSSGWRVQWEPSVIYSGLRPGGRIQQVRTDARPAPRVLSRSGKPFMVMQPVNEVIINPDQTNDLGRTVQAVARAIAPMAPQITSDVILKKISGQPGEPVVAVTLRDPDMKVLTTDPGKIRGVTVHKSERLVMTNRQLSSPLEDGLTNYWQAIRDVTAGWKIVVAQPGEAPQRLDGEQGPAGPNIATTIDPRVQRAVGDAAIEVAQPTTILALDGKTGGILGMGRNKAATDRGISIDGEYTTGSSLAPVFDAVTAYASKNEVDTAELLDRLGLGVVFTVPGASSPQRNGIGVERVDFRPGEVRASMLNVGALGVALARATNGEKTSVPPFVIKGQQTRVHEGKLGPVQGELVRPILDAMARTARRGDASDLTDAKGLRALVGTNGPDGPGWFLGIVDKKVIVIYTEGSRSGTAALQAAQKYLKIR